jgi:hypothetical protein
LAPADLSIGWAAAPVLAALAAAPLVVHGADGDEVGNELRLHGGDSLASLLATGRDVDREVGGFGPVARMMDQLPAAQVAAIWSAAQVIPEGLLHRDSRSAAAKQLFDVRHAVQLAPVIKLIERDLGRVRRTLKEGAPPSVYAQLDARLDQDFTASWQLLPAASFGWAALARLKAHDLAPSEAMPAGRREAWAELAKHAPDYVGMDLVLADALILSARKLDRRAQA